MSSPLTSEQVARIRKLIQAVYLEQADAEEMAELRQWIQSNREAAWIYAQYMHLFAGLHWDKMRESTPAPSAAPLAPSGDSSVLGFLGGCLQQGMSFFSRPSVFWSLVVMGLPGLLIAVLMLALVWRAPRASDVAWQSPPKAYAAMITRAYGGGSLSHPAASLSTGRVFSEGETISLDRGLVEITFADGARVILEEKATLEIRGRNSGSLRMGRLAATVPKSAHGFTIDTPAATVVDLGTDFGVSVDADSTSEAHVFGGQIEVTRKAKRGGHAGATRRLRVGQAARIRLTDAQEGAIEEIGASDDEFVRRFPVGLSEGRNARPGTAGSTERLIASVNRHDGATGNRAPAGPFDPKTPPSVSDPAGLRVGALYYSDRVYPVETIDESLVGADYIRTFNSDKHDGNHRYNVTFTPDRDKLFVMVLVDDRVGKSRGQRQAIVDRIVSRFARSGDFVDTGYDVEIDDAYKTPHPLSAYGMTMPTKDKSGKPIAYVFCASRLRPGTYCSQYGIAVLPEAPRPRE